MFPEHSPSPWQERYVHGNPGTFRIYSGETVVAEVQTKDEDRQAPDAHLITAAPLLYEALRELLDSTEAGLMKNGEGCECERCESAKHAAYRALGFAEGRTGLKEGQSGTF